MWPLQLIPTLADVHQSALAPSADQAGRISHLWWLYLVVLSAVWAIVIGLVLRGTLRRLPSSTGDAPAVQTPSKPKERWLTVAVVGGLSATVVILVSLLFIDFFTSRAIARPAPEGALKIKLTGHQWWWEIRYENPTPSKIVTTANEFHLPLGQPVVIELESVDVIHSFWLPNLHGKRDLIPGHPTSTWFTPDKAGTYYGQCAEFCGLQHAHMQLAATVEPPEQFTQWLEAQRQPAPEPASPQLEHGRKVFLTSTCVICHSIEGTPARGTLGPDLTHVASRERLGAGALRNERNALAGWIADPPSYKPGVLMPQHAFPAEDLNALVDYLQSLH